MNACVAAAAEPAQVAVGPVSPAARYGAFHCDGMALALPVTALREAVPMCTTGRLEAGSRREPSAGDALHTLVRIPCAAAFVVGGLELRGDVLPVVDLALALGRPAPPGPRARVLVVGGDGRRIGLAVDSIDGVFTAPSIDPGRGPGDGLYDVSLQRDDDGSLVQCLSLPALLALPGLVAPVDPPAARASRIEACLRPMVLLRCGPLKLAIDALAVQSTLASPVVRASALAGGDCRGVIEHGGRRVAAVDLQALCGWGPQVADPARPGPAVTLALGAGVVALLVDAVEDVITVRPDQRVPLSALGLPTPGMFDAALSLTAPASRDAPSGAPADDGAPYLCLSVDALRRHDLLCALASLSDAPTSAGVPAATRVAGDRVNGTRVVSFMLDTECAVPIESVVEILRSPSDLNTFGRHGREAGATLGMMVSRGRSIPVLDLRGLAGIDAPPLAADASVLVVRCGQGFAGFAVPSLKSIETIRWTPTATPGRLGVHPGRIAALGVARHALLGVGAEQRVVPVLDLPALALRLSKAGAEPAQRSAM